MESKSISPLSGIPSIYEKRGHKAPSVYYTKLILLWLTIFCSDCQIDLSGIRIDIVKRYGLQLNFHLIWNPHLLYIGSLIQPNLSAFCCLVSWTLADKESLHPVVLPPRKDKLSLLSGFRESAVSLSLSYISMVFLAYQVSLNVNGIFYSWISLTESRYI